VPRTTYLLNAEQRAYLHSIEVKARALERHTLTNKAKRDKLQAMITNAKAMGIPYTRIAKVTKLSPERLSQIAKERNANG
jgi:hypothetical protein